MDRATFETRLQTATAIAVEFARDMVHQSLPAEVVYRVHPNQSYDGHPRLGDEVIFPGDSLPEGSHLGPCSVAEVADFLWRDGRVPEWIDISVETVVENCTVVRLQCCGRFSAEDQRLYYRGAADVAPFGIKSPL